jgi:hypothetical protein
MQFLWILLTSCILHIAASDTNPITVENSRAGTNEWWYEQPKSEALMQGFAEAMSYQPFETVRFKISTEKSVQKYSIGIYRLGYYAGKGGRLLGNITVDETIPQPPCYFENANNLVDCSNWNVTAEWVIPQDATSGVYIALPVYQGSTTAYGSYIPFVVRKNIGIDSIASEDKNGRKRSEILFKVADLTWEAYNKYGEFNLYRGKGWAKADTRARKVSYNRPWRNRMLPPEGFNLNFIFGSEFPMIFWLEKHGYDVSYCSCADIEMYHKHNQLRPEMFRVILSVGHDEYWTPGMKVAHEFARDSGVHLAFFSGNEVFWRVQWAEDIAGNAKPSNDKLVSNLRGSGFAELFDAKSQKFVSVERKRIVVCHKETLDNAVYASNAPSDWTGTFRDPRHRPAESESLLTGQLFMVNGVRFDSLAVTSSDASLRFWRNTSFYTLSNGLRSGSNFKDASADKRVVYRSAPGILGYEWDAFPDDKYNRPHGLFPLSTTSVHLHRYILQNYGTTYVGSGDVVHRLSMYRRNVVLSSATMRGVSLRDVPTLCELNISSSLIHRSAYADVKGIPSESRKVSSALVFGAGTCHWSWGLSSWHELYNGRIVPEDSDIQQATLNLFADMGVLPWTFVAFTSSSAKVLVFPSESRDVTPPSSAILRVEHSANKHALLVWGKAEDSGGGQVAAVEVSVDGGRSWELATGRHHWQFVHYFGSGSSNTAEFGDTIKNATVKNCFNVFASELNDENSLVNAYRNCLMADGRLYNGSLECQSSKKRATVDLQMLIMSRSIDDSGWKELEHDSFLSASLDGLCELSGFGRNTKHVSTNPYNVHGKMQEINVSAKRGGLSVVTSGSVMLKQLHRNVLIASVPQVSPISCPRPRSRSWFSFISSLFE